MAVAATPVGFEVVTARPPEIHAFDPLGNSLGSRVVGDSTSLAVSAARSSNGWAYQVETGSGDIFIRSTAGQGMHPIPSANYVALTWDGPSLVSTELHHPFAVGVVHSDGKVQAVARPPAGFLDSLRLRRGGTDFAGLASLPALPVGRGFLQTVTDVQSDRRLLVVYDEELRVLRASMLSVPIGFVLSVPERRELYGARAGRRTELLKYRWKWGPTEPKDR